MIPYGSQFIDKNDINEVVKVLKSNYLTQGPKVEDFEKKLAKYCGAKYAVAVSNGTAALHLAYLAAGLKTGDEVITTPNTFVATANMLLVVGARPIFCDIRDDTYNIDVPMPVLQDRDPDSHVGKKIEKLITKKTKAIIPVHFAGHPCEMNKIKIIAKKHKLLVIEDACPGLGAKYKNSKIGNCQYSDMAVFSFHAVKSITTGEGGAVLTNNEKFYKKLIHLRSHGVVKDKKGKNVMTELGFNYRMTDIQAALGVSQLKKINKFIKKRHQVVKWYQEELGDLRNIILPVELPDNYSSWHIYVIRTVKKGDRDGLMKYLKDNNVGVNFHYPAVYSHPYYQKTGYKDVKLRNMDQYHNTCLTLPCHTKLTRNNIRYISALIKKYFYKKHGEK